MHWENESKSPSKMIGCPAPPHASSIEAPNMQLDHTCPTAHAALPSSAPRCNEPPQWEKAVNSYAVFPKTAPNPTDSNQNPLHTTMSAALPLLPHTSPAP